MMRKADRPWTCLSSLTHPATGDASSEQLVVLVSLTANLAQFTRFSTRGLLENNY